MTDKSPIHPILYIISKRLNRKVYFNQFLNNVYHFKPGSSGHLDASDDFFLNVSSG